MAQKKEIVPIDHKRIGYDDFRKNFYLECKELQDLTEKQVERLREELGHIKIRGRDCPRPILSWYQAGLSDQILNLLINIKKYQQPFAIQCQCIPVIMSGRDVIGIAETGSGKTLAYALPMFRHISDQRALREGEGPIGLILAPTRELAQ